MSLLLAPLAALQAGDDGPIVGAIRVVFVESDATHVRQRPVLVPDDPSYPGIQNHRFARVGGEIEKLRVGVVDPDGQNMQWLPIEQPEEGFYLGQVDWSQMARRLPAKQF